MAQPLIAGALVFGVGKGYASVKGFDAPIDMYISHAAMMGAAKIAADTTTKDIAQRAVSSGLLFAGMCYLLYKDDNWVINGALGVGASYVADIVVPAPEKEEELV